MTGSFCGVGIRTGVFTCSRVRHQVEDVARFRVDVEAHIHVPLRQMDYEVRVIVH